MSQDCPYLGAKAFPITTGYFDATSFPPMHAGKNMMIEIDSWGRCLPTHTDEAAHHGSRRYFQITRPSITDEALLTNLKRAFPDLGIDDLLCIDHWRALRARIESLPQLKNLLSGTVLPFALPKIPTGIAPDEWMDHVLLPSLAHSFEALSPGQVFKNHCTEPLSKKLILRKGTRHERLLNALEDGPIVGLYLPCLSGYSFLASSEQLNAFPDDFVLSGCVDLTGALIANPRALIRHDGYAPLLWLSAYQAHNNESGYHFESYGLDLTFNRRAHLNQVAEYWWHGISIFKAA